MSALTLGALLILSLAGVGAAQREPARSCSTPTHVLHKVSCLCGEVSICSGDICLAPSNYGLDDEITVELRDKTGATVIASTKVVKEDRREYGTTQDNMRRSHLTSVRKFCFEGQRNGLYQLAFVTYKNGVPEPAIVFPVKYRVSRKKSCDSVYMVESCPKNRDNER